MKTKISLIFLLLVSLANADYDISWHTIDGGGGTSSGGPYSLIGSIGQPEPGVSEGGDYVLSGGFLPGSYGCVVGMVDLARFMAQWLGAGVGLAADLDDSGTVDIVDFGDLSYYWYDWCPAGWTLK